VTALVSALAYRDSLTGEHSRRVADLCVATARGLMGERECYVLEVAALLHDIGKLGVPDAILLKPGPLTPEEWQIMRRHDRIGVEIISAAFFSPELTQIVGTHHAYFGGTSRDPSLPTGEDIPLGARILMIADAFDAMVSDRVYRKGRSQELAFAELRNCAGTQFDPQLVERFIKVISSNDFSRNQPALAVSKQTALRIGLQIERLAGALDAQDFPNLAAMASRLSATASQEGVPEIAQLAIELESCASADPDLMTVVKLTTDLLQLCRSTQRSYLARQSEEETVESRQ
jgi:putative nucleotidyltransferase with HDIG domain